MACCRYITYMGGMILKFYIRIELENIQPASDHGNPHGVCRGFLCRQPARCIGVCWVPSRRQPARFRLPRAVQVSSVSSRAGFAQQDDLPGRGSVCCNLQTERYLSTGSMICRGGGSVCCNCLIPEKCSAT